MKKSLIIPALAILVSGCATSDHVLFVTKTSISVLDADSKPAGVSIGYDRDEGYIGPRYPNGAIPPVIASINSDTGILNPKVSQLYATGNAARVAAGDESAADDEPVKLIGKDKEMMFFGTSTSVGLKIGTTNNIPDSFLFGFRRKEMSFIPLAQQKTDDGLEDIYPSVLASIKLNSDTSLDSASLANQQFFATGQSANSLAKVLGPTFVKKAEQAAGQKAVAGSAISCYVRLPPDLKRYAWKNAQDLNLFHEADGATVLLDKLNQEFAEAFSSLSNYQASGNQAEFDTFIDKLTYADALYSRSLYISGPFDLERDLRLKEHENAMCALSAMVQGTR